MQQQPAVRSRPHAPPRLLSAAVSRAQAVPPALRALLDASAAGLFFAPCAAHGAKNAVNFFDLVACKPVCGLCPAPARGSDALLQARPPPPPAHTHTSASPPPV